MNYVLKLTKNSRVINALIAVQLAVVFALILIMMSAINNRTVYYSKFEKALSENGICIIPNIDGKNMRSNEDMLKVFDKATNITSGKANMLLINTLTENAISTYGYMTFYSSELMSQIPPYLKEGKYPDADSKIPQCLACDNFGYKIGDKLDITDWSGVEFTMEICGIMSDDQNIYGTGGPAYYEYKQDYRDFYYQLHSQMRTEPLFLSTDEIMDKVNCKGRNDFYCMTIVNFPKGTYTQDEIDQMSSELGYSYFGNTDEYYENSEKYVNQELRTLLPVALSILVVTLFTAIITTMITTMNNLKNYAVLYLCGATWKRCSLINLMNFCVISIVTLILDTAFFLVGKNTFLKDTVVKISLENLLVCVGILVLFLVLSAVVPLLVVRKKQPRDVLKTEFRQ